MQNLVFSLLKKWGVVLVLCSALPGFMLQRTDFFREILNSDSVDRSSKRVSILLYVGKRVWCYLGKRDKSLCLPKKRLHRFPLENE